MVDYDRLPNDSRYFSGTLYGTMRDDLQLDGKAKRTVHGYLRAVRQLADYCQRTPDQISGGLCGVRLGIRCSLIRRSVRGLPRI